MRSLEEILDTAAPRKAFSNGTSWEIWAGRWCDDCFNDINEDCPLVTAAVLGGVLPTEWSEVGTQNYDCAEFQPREEST